MSRPAGHEGMMLLPFLNIDGENGNCWFSQCYYAEVTAEYFPGWSLDGNAK